MTPWGVPDARGLYTLLLATPSDTRWQSSDSQRGDRSQTNVAAGAAEAGFVINDGVVATPTVQLGLVLSPQFVEWKQLHQTAILVDQAGFDTLWTWDHLYPTDGSQEGPIFEGYLTLAGWAMATKRVRLGLMVGANTFRNPALTAKMVTTLDHMTVGRAILGIGGAWFEPEHRAYGIQFGNGFGDRLEWLDEAVMIMRGMLDGTRPSGRSMYPVREVVNNPPPVQAHLPILVGGGGEKKTLATVARYADMCNFGGDVETVRRKDEILRRWCDEVGRNSDDIERTLSVGPIVVRESYAEAQRVVKGMLRNNLGWLDGPEIVGTPDEVVDHLAPYLNIGFHHFVLDLPTPFDHETIELLARDVRSGLQARVANRTSRGDST